jgi:isoquinoline 1-oxidoreductase beta subunit
MLNSPAAMPGLHSRIDTAGAIRMSRATSSAQPVLSRREFVITTATLGGGLMLGIGLPAQEAGQRPAAPGAPARSPNTFIQIAADDSITIVVPAVEMGQGAHTALPMILMEELGGDWRRLEVADAPADKRFDNPAFGGQQTVGSRTVRGWYDELRRLAAAAREMLVAAAAQQWQVPAGECTAAGGSSIVHAPSGRKLSYGSVAAAAAKLPVPQQPALKKFDDFKVIGTSPARVDVPAKVDGSAQFGIDKRLPDMLYGAVRGAPTLTGKLKSFDAAAARGMPGFHSAVALDDGVVVLADSWWQAKNALEKVTAEFEPGRLAGLDSVKVSSLLQGGFEENMRVAKNEGDVDGALASAGTVLEAVYEVPYLAHACLEPMNCTAQVSADTCEVWCGTQSPQSAQSAAAAVLKIPPERVTVNAMYLGGGFGRRGPSDYVTQAVTAAKAVAGRPVKLIWSREEDIKHDWYRPAAAIRFRAGIAGTALAALECRVVSASAPGFEGPNSPPSYAGGVADMRYLIPNFRVTALNKDLGVRFGFWRSVNLSHNPFMVEGILDEVAARTRQDPYQFRRALLQHERGLRQLGALDLAAQKAGWGKAPAGHFQGIASLEGFGSFIASVVEVSMQDSKTVVIHRIVNAIDCGVAVHPANIVAQMDGGTIFGLTAVGRGEITLANGAVVQNNFNDYRMLHMAEAPRCESYIVRSREAPGGVGEPGTGPIAPALANAIFAATGTRIRSLPLSRHGLQLAAGRVRA